MAYRTDRIQQERFTARIRNILSDYPLGLGCFKEFLANADDAGATAFAVVLDMREHGKEKLVSDGLSEWQGPAIFFHNSQPAFTSEDLDCFTRSVGDSAKAGDSSRIGQFGLGAITAYHFTDVIQLITGEELLLLDTHKLYLPGREESINANLWDTDSAYFHRALDEWPDTVSPFVAVTKACPDVMAPLRLPPADSSAGYEPGSTHDISLQALVLSPDVCQPSGGGPVAEARETACSPPRCPASKRKRDSLSDDGGGSAALAEVDPSSEAQHHVPNGYPGTLFRLPLRSKETAERSEVCKEPGSPERLQELMHEFAAAAHEMLLFTRNVRKVSVLIMEPGQQRAKLLGKVVAYVRTSEAIPAFNGRATEVLVDRDVPADGIVSGDKWLKVAVSNPDNTGQVSEVAACLGRMSASGTSAALHPVSGNLFCCMPLPFSGTGLPVHVNGSWRLQSNRRELWTNIDDERKLGQDNIDLLKHCTAPAWAALLHLLTVSERRMAMNSSYTCVAILHATIMLEAQISVGFRRCLGRHTSELLAQLPAMWRRAPALAWNARHWPMARRLWPPPATLLRPAPLDRLTSDVAARLVAADLPVLLTAYDDGCDADCGEGVERMSEEEFVRPSDAVFPPIDDAVFSSAAQRDTVLRVCRRLGVPLVEPPTHIDEALEAAMAASGSSLRRLTPQLVREILQSPAAPARMRRAELGPLLAYVISDAPGEADAWSDAFAERLDGLPLLRLADEHQRHDSVSDSGRGPEGIALLRMTPSGRGGGNVWLCHKSDNQDYPRLLGWMAKVYPVDTTDTAFLVAIEVVVGNTSCNVKVPGPEEFAAALPSAWVQSVMQPPKFLPRGDGDGHAGSSVERTIDGGSAPTLRDWLGSFWAQSEAHWDGGVPAVLKDHALVPVSGGLLASAQHCADRVLLRSCDMRQFPLAAPPAELLACLVALRCLVTEDPRCDRVRVLSDPVSGEPVAEAASKVRVLAALQALPAEELLSDLAALTTSAQTRTDSQASGDEQHADKAAAHIETIRTVVADAVTALHGGQQLHDGFLAKLPLFRVATGGHGPADHAWLAPNTHWELVLRPCAGLLPKPLLASAEADHQQHALLRAAGLDPPPLPAFVLDQLLPAIAVRLAARPPLSEEAVAQLEELHLSAVAGLSREMPLAAQQLEDLETAPLVVDDGQPMRASAFVVLGEDAEGLRPIVSGPDFPLRPLPAKFSSAAFGPLLEAAGLHSESSETLYLRCLQRCRDVGIARLGIEQREALRKSLAGQDAWWELKSDMAEMLAMLPFFETTTGDWVALYGPGRRPTCLDPPSDDWQELLHERIDALPRPVLKRWHADPTQKGLLRNAGQSNQPVAEELILQLLRHVASHPDDRRLEPLVLRCLQQLHPHNGGSVRGLRVVFKEDSAAEAASNFVLFANQPDAVLRDLLPRDQHTLLPEPYHPYAALLSEAGLVTKPNAALIRQCIVEYMRRHEAQAGGPAELREIGRRLVRRIQAGYKDVMHSHRVWLSAARFIPTHTLGRPRSLGAFGPVPALTSLGESVSAAKWQALVTSVVPLTEDDTDPLRIALGYSNGCTIERVVEHLINYTGPAGIARQRMEAGEGRREMEEDLTLLYSTVFKFAASHQALAATADRVADSPRGGAGYRGVAGMLRGARWIRVPSPGGAAELHFVTAAQLCFDLAAPNGGFFPPPESLCDDVPVDQQRSFLLNLGAVSAQQGASMPPPLPADAGSRQAALLAALPNAFDDKSAWPDLVVEACGQEISVHRVLLGLLCKPLAAMLNGAPGPVGLQVVTNHGKDRKEEKPEQNPQPCQQCWLPADVAIGKWLETVLDWRHRLRGNWSEKDRIPIQIPPCDSCGVLNTYAGTRTFLRFFYAGELIMEADDDQEEFELLKQLLVWGGMYCVPAIVAECEHRLWRFVGPENVCTLLFIANHHMAAHLKERCISCGGKWLDMVRDTEDFGRLPRELSDAVLAAHQQQAA